MMGNGLKKDWGKFPYISKVTFKQKEEKERKNK
jgi:hypothetical protein